MARVDDYRESFRLASLELRERDLQKIAACADAALIDREGLEARLSFLGSPYIVKVKDHVEIEREDIPGEVPLPEKVLILHYLLGAFAAAPSGRFISFRQISDGQFYFEAFQRRARDPFLGTFGEDPDAFRSCAAMLGGTPVQAGDVAMEFRVLPNIHVRIVLWKGDDEFPPDAGILFNSEIQYGLSAEDIAVLSGMLVYRLMAVAKKLRSGTPGAGAGEGN